MMAIWSLAPLLFLNPGWTSVISQFTYCWSLTWKSLHWFSLGLEGNWAFPALWPPLSFLNLLVYWEQHFHSIIIFLIWNSSTGIPSPPLALFVTMLPKAHLTSHSRMSGSQWVITPSWLSTWFRSFLYSSFVYSCHLFLISSSSVRSIAFLSFILPIFARKILFNFLEEISNLFHLLFSSISLHWSLRKAFLSLCAILWNSAFRWV